MGCGKEGKPMGLSMDMTGSLHPRLAQHGAGFFFKHLHLKIAQFW